MPLCIWAVQCGSFTKFFVCLCALVRASGPLLPTPLSSKNPRRRRLTCAVPRRPLLPDGGFAASSAIGWRRDAWRGFRLHRAWHRSPVGIARWFRSAQRDQAWREDVPSCVPLASGHVSIFTSSWVL
ncbi:hypothetical protein GUJ93_ZPchr0005g16280 [Zizania palustris]|uniref:Secreted protein n=1 Tax=Zizania palustris TaxID=103762 RepID=A0A8J5S546_ZIZPA|nr:hypothetical protein GUJ93_ZPchr0005g16280 [Zizania palustris]